MITIKHYMTSTWQNPARAVIIAMVVICCTIACMLICLGLALCSRRRGADDVDDMEKHPSIRNSSTAADLDLYLHITHPQTAPMAGTDMLAPRPQAVNTACMGASPRPLQSANRSVSSSDIDLPVYESHQSSSPIHSFAELYFAGAVESATSSYDDAPPSYEELVVFERRHYN